MALHKNPMGKGCAIVAGVIVGVPLLIAMVVGVQTWAPLHAADEALTALDQSLGHGRVYTPGPSGGIPAERMELFLELRATLVEACGDYGRIQTAFDSVDSLDHRDSRKPAEVGDVALDLGGAALSITPFLARYFELRNEALLEASMGLQEYSYIYAAAYHDRLLSARTRREIFSDGVAVSPEAAVMLRECLSRQLQSAHEAGLDPLALAQLATELERMENNPSGLIWQEGLPEALRASVTPYRERLDRLFCGATAGLEMEQNARRALRLALE